MENDTFSHYIRIMRAQKGISLRRMAGQLLLSPSYYNDLEKGYRNPPRLEKLELFSQILSMTEDEKNHLFNLAGKAVGQAPPDLIPYLLSRPDACAALRIARDLRVTEQEWEEFITTIQQRKTTE